MAGLEVAASFVELAGGLRELARKDPPAARGTVKEVIVALRTIYFTPKGAMSLIEQLANGERPSAERIADVLPEFNDKEWRILHELRRLDFDRLYESGELSIRQCQTLRLVSDGKKNLRRAIQDFLNEALTGDEVPPAVEARKLLEEVRQFNSLIEDAEERLR